MDRRAFNFLLHTGARKKNVHLLQKSQLVTPLKKQSAFPMKKGSQFQMLSSLDLVGTQLELKRALNNLQLGHNSLY